MRLVGRPGYEASRRGLERPGYEASRRGLERPGYEASRRGLGMRLVGRPGEAWV